jgi:hypothetical protein
MPIYKDRVQETTTTTGTGTVTLGGAVSGFRTFTSALADGDLVNYVIALGAEWEVGEGTFTASGTTLSRTTVLASSNSNALVSFSAGTKNVWVDLPADHIANISKGLAGIRGLRLTLTTAKPVTAADVTGAGTIYLTPFRSGQIALWDGKAWVVRSTAEISLALTLVSGSIYDVFAYWSGSAVVLELSAAWASDFVRTDALTTQDGVTVKSGTVTRRQVGTIRASGTNTTEDSFLKRFVWNGPERDMQVVRHMRVSDATNSWSAITNSTSWQQVRAQTANKVEFVCGAHSPSIEAKAGLAFAAVLRDQLATGINVDGTTANSAVPTSYNPLGSEGTSGPNGWASAEYVGYATSAGYHYVAWMEVNTAQTSGTYVYYGDNGGTLFQSGMTAKIFG